MEKLEILNKYCDLSKKLGKLLSYRDVEKLICSSRQLQKHFNTLKELKTEALKQQPELEFLTTPAQLTIDDLTNFRLKDKLQSKRKQNDKLVKNVSTLEYIQHFSENIFKGKVQGNIYKSNKITKRVLNLILSDLHIGADIDGEETGVSSFGTVEEARRLAKVVEQVCEYKKEYRKETELNILFLGDIIQGMLNHDMRDGAQLAEQFCRAVHLLTQAFARFGQEFKKVTVYCTTGNHDRNVNRHQSRAIHGKYDSYATMLAYSLKHSLSQFTNIVFEIPKTPYVKVKALDYNFYAWHGDTGVKTGSVGNSVNVKNIVNAINDINAPLSEEDKYSVFLCGHLHLGTVSFLPNGTTLLVNGGLPPVDSFSLSLGRHCTNSGQLMFESVPGHAVGDIRFIQVDNVVDKNEEYDKLISPWKKYDE